MRRPEHESTVLTEVAAEKAAFEQHRCELLHRQAGLELDSLQGHGAYPAETPLTSTPDFSYRELMRLIANQRVS